MGPSIPQIQALQCFDLSPWSGLKTDREWGLMTLLEYLEPSPSWRPQAKDLGVLEENQLVHTGRPEEHPAQDTVDF